MPGQRGTTLHRARRLTTKVGVVPVDDLVQMLADGLWVCGAGDRQDVLEQGGRYAEGDQRRPTALQIQQLRRGVFGQQLGQRAEGLAVRWVAATAVEARTG